VNCLIGPLKGIVAALAGLANQLNSARAAGNTELVTALEGAQKNAETKAATLVASIEPVQVVLELASPFFARAGVLEVHLPSGPPNTDPSSLTQLLAGLESSAASLQAAADALGGCSG
jgi:hypothetical protein